MGIIIAIETIGFVLAILWSVIDWGHFLREHFANNPAKGRVYIEVEEDLIKVDAKLTASTNKGQVYKYRWQGKDKIVILGPNYPVRYCDGRRTIALRAGRLVASRLYGMPAKDEPNAEIIASLVLSGIITDLVMSLTGKGFPKWIWIIAGIGGLALMAYLLKGCGGTATPVTPPANTPVNPETGQPFGALLALMGV
jgi:hypothetical protein